MAAPARLGQTQPHPTRAPWGARGGARGAATTARSMASGRASASACSRSATVTRRRYHGGAVAIGNAP